MTDPTMSARTPGPWVACQDGRCPCATVWSKTADHPVLEVTRGKWGDHYPTLENVGTEIAPEFRPVTRMIEYGEVLADTAEANAKFIVTACNAYDADRALIAELRRVLGELTTCIEHHCREIGQPVQGNLALAWDQARAALSRADAAEKEKA